MSKGMILRTALLILCMSFTACGKADSYHTTDRNEYMQIEGHIENEGMDVDSGLYIFPKSIEEYENVTYEYRCDQGLLDNSYMIFLKIKYPDEKMYDNELERLQNVSCSIETTEGTIENNIEYSDELFAYPAYIAIYDCHVSFEYALTDDASQEVTYVYLRFYDDFSSVQKKYRPLEFQDGEIDYNFTWENTNIYYTLDNGKTHINFRD